MFYFDFPIDIQNFLNQYSLAVHMLLLSLLAVMAFLAYKKPLLGAAGVIILFPTYLFRTNLFGVPTTFLEMSFLTVICVFFFRGFLKKEFKKTGYRYPLQKPILLLLVASVIAVLVSPNLRAALGLWKAYIIEPIIFFVFLLNVVKTDRDKEIILWALGLSALPIALLAIFQKFTGFGIALPQWAAQESRRVTALYTSPNAAALFLGPIAAAYVSWLVNGIIHKTHQIANIAKFLLSIILFLAIIFTVSRGAWFGLAAALFFIGFFQINKKWTLAIAGILIVLLLIIPYSRQAIIPLITFSQHSGQNRLSLWRGSFEYLTQRPKNFIFGAGIFGFPNVHEAFRDPQKTEPLIYPHNIILNFWMEFGLIGLIAFLLIFIDIFNPKFPEKNWQTKSQAIKIAAIAAFIAIIAHGLVDHPYFKNDLAMLFWTLAALRYM